MTTPGESAVARALASPTRAAILDDLRASGPASVKDVAEKQSIHPNVVRDHLNILVDAGLARATWRRHKGGGRPARVYEAAPTHVAGGPAMVSDMLAALIETVAPDPNLARKIAEHTGEKLAKQVLTGAKISSFEERIELLLRALSGVSGGVRVVARGKDFVEIEDLDCPFANIAASHPELACTLDKALKEGVMRGLGARNVWVEVIGSVGWGDATCRETVRWKAPAKSAARELVKA